MAEHNATFELYYDGAYVQAPVLTRGSISYRRGVTGITNDTDPAEGRLTIDNSSGLYAPRSATSGLRGKIGQNTPARLSADGSVRLTAEVSSWRPRRPVKGSGWTDIVLSGVLQRIGRGTDPLDAPLTRAARASGPVDWWPLDDGRNATTGANIVPGGAAMANLAGRPAVTWGGLDEALVPDGMAAMPALGGGGLTATVRGTSTTSWRFEAVYGIEGTIAPGLDVIRGVVWRTAGGINTWWVEHGETATIIWAYSDYSPGLLFGSVVLGSGDARFHDGQMHHITLDVQQTTSVDFTYQIYLDGVLRNSGTNSTGTTVGRPQIGPPSIVTVNPDGDSRMLSAGGVGFWSPSPGTPISHSAVDGYAGELAAARFSRLLGEEGLTATVVGTAADTEPMGPQQRIPMLDQLDEIARTDDASIFETRTALGLTMRTGQSKLNQAAALTLNYLGQIQPGLEAVVGDEGLRNDVTAANPSGSSRQVVQTSGPRNVGAPGVVARGVGRYKTRVDVNTATDDALLDAAGWRVNLGTFDGTWYAEVTVDLDAAPGLVSAVNAVDIGDLVAIANLPVDEALDTVAGLVIGIEESLPPKRRLVTFYLVPAAPYLVGVLANTSGDTGAFVGHLESDGATVTAAVAAGAATFQISIPSGPLWTTVADDFPQDVLLDGQRVTITAVSGASSPQTATVTTTGTYTIRYPVRAGAIIDVQQPIILTM